MGTSLSFDFFTHSTSLHMKNMAFGLVIGLLLMNWGIGNAQQGCEALLDQAVLVAEKGDLKLGKQKLEEMLRTCCREGQNWGIVCAGALSSMANLAVLEGDPAKALTLCSQADSLFKKEGAQNSEGYGSLMFSMAGAYYRLGRMTEALPAIDTAIAMAVTQYGRGSKLYGIRISTRAAILMSSGRIQEAFPIMEESFQISDSAEHYSRNTATLAINLAALAGYVGDFKKGLAYIQHAQLIADSILSREDPLWENIDGALGFMEFKNGQFRAAIGHLETAYKTATTRLKGENNSEALRPMITLSSCYLNLGDDTKAEFFLEKCLQTGQLLATMPSFYGIVCANFSQLYLRKRQYALALKYAQESLKSLEKSLKGRYNVDYANALNNLAVLYGESNQMQLAVPLAQEAMTILDSVYGQTVHDHLVFFNNLMAAQSRIGADEAALQSARAAFALIKNNPNFRRSAYYPRTLFSLGHKHLSLSRPDSALHYFHHAAQVYDSLRIRPAEYAWLLEGFAKTHETQQQPVQAERYFQSAIQFTRDSSADRTLRYGSLLHHYARFLLKNDRAADALPYVRELTDLIGQNLDVNAAAFSEQGKVAFAEQANALLDVPLSLALDHAEQHPEALMLATDAVLRLRGSALKSTRATAEAIRSSGNAALLRQYEQWQSAAQVLNFQYQRPKSERTLDARSLDSLALAADLLETQLVAASAAYRREQQIATGSLVRRALLPGEAAVQFIRHRYMGSNPKGDSIYYVAHLYGKTDAPDAALVFLCTEKDLRRRLSLGNVGSPESGIANIYGPSPKVLMGDTSRTLYDLLWKPLETQLAGTQTLWLSPDGLLHGVAFDALRESPKATDLASQYQLRYLASAGDLIDRDSLFMGEIGTAALFGNIAYRTDAAQMLAQRPGGFSEKKPPAMTAKPEQTTDLEQLITANYPRGTRGALTPLPFTKREIEAAQALLRRASALAATYQGYEALEEQAKAFGKNHPSPGLLHFATHGDYLNDDPSILNPLDRTALFFAGADSSWRFGQRVPSMEDQILRASEVAGQNLSHTRLAVLSACKSGLGDVRSSEGVFGFQRAFRLAGVRHLLISQWPVSDRHTAEFMEMFYGQWATGLELRDAFAQAQAQMRAKYPQPYYWAGFVAY
jgi:CHAT domain-containing protein